MADVPVTTELTEAEETLLDVLLQPENINLPVTKLCEKSGINTATYYRAFKKDHFVRRLQDEAVVLIHGSVIPILHKAKENALKDIPSSHHWAKILLEMSGMYVPNKAANVKTDVKIIINVPRPVGAATVIDVTPGKDS